MSDPADRKIMLSESSFRRDFLRLKPMVFGPKKIGSGWNPVQQGIIGWVVIKTLTKGPTHDFYRETIQFAG